MVKMFKQWASGEMLNSGSMVQQWVNDEIGKPLASGEMVGQWLNGEWSLPFSMWSCLMEYY